jgi:2-polyprenyl-6-hydroxyphenyl methylase/3-demethylubiquinone-9 3-methyltransferase
MMGFMDVDEQEIRKFERISENWWDSEGEMRTLHTINPLRLKFIKDNLNLPTSRILDVGCGGGILSEALAKSGAQVVGTDLSQACLEVARQHARRQSLNIDYRYESLVEVVQENAGRFDAVTCMELLEHVPDPGKIVAACAQVLKPGGHFFCSTINRTLKAFLFAIIGGEYILHLLPKGSHTYKKLIRPQELIGWTQASGLELEKLTSLIYNPFTCKFFVAEWKAYINYMAHFIKN